ncbi:acyl-CoA N-acyltransferase [Boletus coccyginus]|nr:acyl-CoA N-acyltransferase [Boletus coccyginus]
MVMSAQQRLRAVQNALLAPVDVFLLPDRTSVDIVQLPPAPGSPGKAEIRVDGMPVCTYHPLDRTATLLPSAVGTPHEHTATHAPTYPVLEICPAMHRITVQDAWAAIYALFVRHHDRETIPIVFSPDTANLAELGTYILRSGLGRTAHSKRADSDALFLLRAAFWQGAGTHGYHSRGWLPPLASLTCHAASPFPWVQSFTRTPLVITANPLRPPKPLPGEVLYRRYCPCVQQTLEFTYFDVGQDGQVTPHLEAFHKWHNDDRVNSGWNERGSLEQHRSYVHGVLNDPAVLPMMMSWDGELMGYLEIVYIKVRRYARLGARTHMSSQENHVATYVPGGAKEWDRGMHVLVGEERFRGWERGGCCDSDVVHA